MILGPLIRLGLSALLLVPIACASPVGLNHRDERQIRAEVTSSVVSSGRLSDRTRHLLQRLELVERYAKEPAEAIATIHAGLGGPQTSTELLALSELSFQHGERSGDRAHFRAAAVYAWAYLFPDDGRPEPDPYGPGLRLAVELYNRGLTRGLASDEGESVELASGPRALPFGTLHLTLDETSLEWSGHRMDRFVPTAEFEIRGLRNRYRRAGIGAPLAASLARTDSAPATLKLPPSARVAATAFLRLEGLSEGIRAGEVHGSLEIYVLDEASVVAVSGRVAPLEYEPSVVLASMFEGNRIRSLESSGFFAGGSTTIEGIHAGLYSLHPYRPGRIPLVLVHGTASSPARWAELMNEIIGDPALAARFQVWPFLYATGNPVLFSGMRLREALRAVVAELDPEGLDPALQQMVVVGHSQGGLLTKLMVVDPGTRFWDGVSDAPLEDLALEPETEDFVRRMGFFEPLPFVRRVVYIATPHRGSYLARRRAAGFLSDLVALPGDLVRQGGELVARSGDARIRRFLENMPTSIDNMAPGHPFTQTLSSLSEAPGVHSHSIIAVKRSGPLRGQNDGVVAYESAHVPGVESELVVRSGHSTQGNPHTVEEVRRILREHLAGIEIQSSGP